LKINGLNLFAGKWRKASNQHNVSPGAFRLKEPLIT